MQIVNLLFLKSLFCFLLLILFIPTQAQTLLELKEWKKVSDDDGVIVHINETGHSQIVRVKTEVTINSSLALIQSILDDVDHRHEWVPFLETSRVLKPFSPFEKLEYSIFYGPWPASDRDFVYRITLYKQNDQQVSYSMISEPDPIMPEQKDKVRAQLIESYYTLTALNDQQTHVELIFHADPKGWVPVWIVNIIQRVLPSLILKNLKERAETE